MPFLLAMALILLLAPIQGVTETDPTEVHFDGLAAFHQAASNWAMVGDAWADPEETHHLQVSEGAGVLVNRPTTEARNNLLSRFEHGDADIELEFMMAKGSNSGIYLQGRYEVQLLDSWGVARPKFSDCGGVYTNVGALTALSLKVRRRA